MRAGHDAWLFPGLGHNLQIHRYFVVRPIIGLFLVSSEGLGIRMLGSNPWGVSTSTICRWFLLFSPSADVSPKGMRANLSWVACHFEASEASRAEIN